MRRSKSLLAVCQSERGYNKIKSLKKGNSVTQQIEGFTSIFNGPHFDECTRTLNKINAFMGEGCTMGYLF
jgi:hypothetical protein